MSTSKKTRRRKRRSNCKSTTTSPFKDKKITKKEKDLWHCKYCGTPNQDNECALCSHPKTDAITSSK